MFRNRFNFAAILLLLSMCTLWCNASQYLRSSEKQKPNIVIVVTDDQGFGDVGYNSKENEGKVPSVYTPNIDRLATSGVILSDFYTQPTCSPSRAALMSGRYPLRFGFGSYFPEMMNSQLLPDKKPALPLDETTLAEKLKTEGYATHMVGKWHMGLESVEHLPINRGFDSYIGNLYGHIGHFSKVFGKEDEAFGVLTPFIDQENAVFSFDLHNESHTGENGKINVELVRDQETYSSDLYTNEAIKRIQAHDATDPLFMYVSYVAPHTPLEALEEDLKACEENVDSDFTDLADRKTFCGMVHSVDRGIGEIENALKEKGILSNTVIIFTSDNGGATSKGASNGRLRGSKGEFYNGGLRVPAWVNIGSDVKQERGISDSDPNYRGATVSAIRHLVDMHTMILDLAQVSPAASPKDMDGLQASWDSILSNDLERSELVIGAAHDLERQIGPQCIISGDFKFIRNPQSSFAPHTEIFELYNLKDDPFEENELLNSTDAAKYDQVLKQLQGRIAFWDTQLSVDFPYYPSILQFLYGPNFPVPDVFGGGNVQLVNNCLLPEDVHELFPGLDCTSLVQ